MLTNDELNRVSILLYVSPDSMILEEWGPVLETLSKKNRISFFCIDEAHEVEQSGRSFRTSFQTATTLIGRFVGLMRHPVPRILLSATIWNSDINVVLKFLGDKTPTVMSGPLDQRNITISVSVTGNPGRSLRTSAVRDLHTSPNHQQVWYTHSRTNTEGGLLDAADAILETHREMGAGPNSIATSFTGGDDIMAKVATMDAIRFYDTLEGV